MNFFKRHHDKPECDVCLLLEGTYPYIRGGVSSWIHQIIKGLPEFNFYIIFLGGQPDFYGKPLYTFPDNVVGFEVHYLLSDSGSLKPSAREGNEKLFSTWGEFLSYFQQNKSPIPDELLITVADFLGKEGQLTLEDFLYSRASWEVLIERYNQTASHHSFVDYFWTYRNIFQPLFVLAKIAQSLPKAKVFHSISTGYAGFLGAMCKQKMQQPYILTEHGIYTKERKIDLSQASWIADNSDNVNISMHKGMESTRKTWITFFEQLGLTAYQQADNIVALFEENRRRQHTDGAPANRTQVIVNGINTKHFESAYLKRPNTPPLVVGLIGRVVPIKDIKTFIRTIRGALESFPQLQGWIIGPTEEDKAYVHECELLIESLDLKDNVKILGSKNIVDIMPKLGIMMLTSISEAQPLVLLEAMASGIPCISTEVGACREIIEGSPYDNDQLGSAGEIIPISNPNEGSQAIIRILSDVQGWKKKGDIGRQRVKRHYDEISMYQAYRYLYQGAINGRNRI